MYQKTATAKDCARIDEFLVRNRGGETVVIQGLGFVGSAMLTAVASAKDREGHFRYAVIGVDLPTGAPQGKVETINSGKLPIKSSDASLEAVFLKSFQSGNIMATTDHHAYEVADIIVVDINLNIEKFQPALAEKRNVSMGYFLEAMRQIACLMKPDTLVVIESTVPPGTCETILLPLFQSEFRKRGYSGYPVCLGHSYERVMPGKNYLKSIVSYYRVFSGVNETAKEKTRKFLEHVIDTEHHPLTELSNVTASEMGKVLENSYRAANIAFVQEWVEFAEAAGVNLFEVIDAIRRRDTHRNIMLPGFGVGGYCLTKDPLLADWAYTELFGGGHLSMSVNAVNINDMMPLHSYQLLEKYLKGLRGRTILLLGISYLNDVADTRHSPSEIFYKRCCDAGATVLLQDPLVAYWPELDKNVQLRIESFKTQKADALILAVKHDEYLSLQAQDYAQLLRPKGLILDANNIIDDAKASDLRAMGFRLAGVGKGHWNRMLET